MSVKIRNLLSCSVALAVTTFGLAPAQAADLGGNCCADLEERIAELEATTAHKGNRKVSLEIYGQVNEAIMFWDDGVEKNETVVTNDNGRTRVGFRGKAKINDEWEAGYRLEIGVRTVNSKRFTQDDPDAAANSGLDMRDSSWYLKSKTLGTVYMGLGTTSTNQITELNLTQTAMISKYSDVEDGGLGLRLRSSANGNLSALSWFRLLGDGGDQPGEGERALNLVRYESPTIAGFVAGASWGEDDVWDVSLKYTGEGAGFKYSAGIGYGVVLDAGQTSTVCATAAGTGSSDTRCANLGGSISVIHELTGLFVSVGTGIKTDDLLNGTERFIGTGADDEQTFWAIQSGVEKKYNEFGKTTIYGEYYDYQGGANGRRTMSASDALNPLGATAAIWSSGVEMFGAGIIQGFDSAGLQVYLSYRHYEADLAMRALVGGVATGAIADAALEDLDVVMTGAIIKF
jgi:predicted porin